MILATLSLVLLVLSILAPLVYLYAVVHCGLSALAARHRFVLAGVRS